MPGPARSILLRLELRPAGKACHCARNQQHAIARGELRLVVKERGPAAGEKGYCVACALAMLTAAQADLAALALQLGPATSS